VLVNFLAGQSALEATLEEFIKRLSKGIGVNNTRTRDFGATRNSLRRAGIDRLRNRHL
jgi:hypothetical protein